MLSQLRQNHFYRGGVIRARAMLSRPLHKHMPSGVFFFHQGRCGSTVVANLLDQNEELSDNGEVFESYFSDKELPASPENILRDCRVRAHPRQVIVAAKFFECQHLSILGLTIEEFVCLVKRSGYHRFIVLNRKNYLRKVVSSALGKRDGKWHFKIGETIPQDPIRLDVNNVRIQGKSAPLVELFDYMEEQYERLHTVLSGDDVLTLSYEDDILINPVSAYERICDWLGVENSPVQVEFAKSNTTELDKLLVNWNEVVEALDGSPYAWMTKVG